MLAESYSGLREPELVHITGEAGTGLHGTGEPQVGGCSESVGHPRRPRVGADSICLEREQATAASG